DFVEASHIMYTLTFNPTIYVSHIRQFWSTARIETTDEGTKILATVDGKLKTASKSSIRRNLKLNDEAGISSLSDVELFENLTLMGYNISSNQKYTFQKGQFSHQWKYLIHTIMQCFSPKSTRFNEFSRNIATALVCLATNRVFNLSKLIFDGMVRNVNNKVSKFLMYLRFLSICLRMGQFGQIPHTHTYVGEGSGKPTNPYHTPTFEASQSSQHKLSSPSLPPIPTESLSTIIPSDNPHFRQYTKRSRIAQSSALMGSSAIGNNSGGETCPTDSGLEVDQDRANIPKTSTLPSDSTPSLQRQQSEMVSKYAAQELEIINLKARVKLLENREEGGIAQSGDDAPIKGRSLDEEEEAAERVSNDTEEMATVLTSMDAARILTSGGVQVVPTVAEVATATVSIPTGSGVVPTASPTIPTAALIFTTATKSTPYTRRKGKEKMVESKTPKKMKISRDAEIARIHAEEELQIMIDGLDRNNETVAKYLQEYHQFLTKLPIGRRIELISDLVKYQHNYAKAGWKAKHFKGITLEEIKEKFDPVWKQIQDFIPVGSKEETERFKRKGLRLEQESVKKLNTSKEVKATKKVPEKNKKDDAAEWKLYDTCGVHHVSTKDKDIFMLIEKDYPLRKGLAIMMISYKLQVENYSQMTNDLIQKIYKIANCPRQQDD
nr:hypothetical protein [Tanacetum cinerariifolium]